MKPRVSLSVARSIPPPRLCTRPTLRCNLHGRASWLARGRCFSSARRLRIETFTDKSYTQPAEDLNNNITQEEKDHYDRQIAENKSKQIRTPWHREGSDKAPVARERSASAMTKGKLLTTPSRMLKLILPLTTRDYNQDRKDVEPLALLVHPQQPLSYLERLIQSELPLVKVDGKEKVPSITFLAQDSMHDSSSSDTKSKGKGKSASSSENDKDSEHDLAEADSMKIDGETVRTGKLNRKSPKVTAILRGGPGEGGVESYSGLGQEADKDATSSDDEPKFVRWSSSTEVGDFIRDAARGREFSIEIEGAPHDIRVGVPSFNDRTYYLRMRLRNTARKISSLADVKHECDHIARKGARRVALAGFGGLCGWWFLVYKLTFQTELGWDVMEPVTYLVGLSTLMGGYVWFLYHNRDVSYRSAMKFTISRRQSKLYAARGFDLDKWQGLIEDGNALRKEIKTIANEYDVEWDERQDMLQEEKVTEALRKEREKAKKNGKDKGDEDEDDG